MKPFAVSLCCLAFALLSFDAAGEDKEQDKKKRSYASAAADCERSIALRKSKLADSYASEVWNLKQRFQRDGDLEKALAADKEWSRSIRREPLTPEDLVEEPKELRALQDAYVDRQGRVEQEVAEEVVAQLRREASELARAGNLADGKVLQREIDTIQKLYLGNSSATAKDKMRQKGGGADKALEDPVAACEEAIRQKRIAIQAQYVGELEALEKSFQAKGALEELFAAKSERKRFMETPLLAEENLVETSDALRELQQKYLELQQNVTTSVAEEFVARLEQQKQALTIEGKLEEAMGARENAAKIRARWLDDNASEDSSGEGLPSNVPPKGLLGWWPLDGHARDLSRNSRSGVIHDAQPALDRFGRRDRAMSFNGRSAFIEISDDGGLALRDSFSVSLWFNAINGEQETQAVFGKGHAAPSGNTSLNVIFNGRIMGSPRLSAAVGVCNQNGFNAALGSKWPLRLGQWVHVACTYDGSALILYLDGKAIETGRLLFQLNNSNVPVMLGQEAQGLNRFFAGSIDDVGVWSRPLTKAEVRQLYGKKL